MDGRFPKPAAAAALATIGLGLMAAAPSGGSTYWQITRSGTQPVQWSQYRMCAPTPVQDMMAQLGQAHQVPGRIACDRSQRRGAEGSDVIELSCTTQLTKNVVTRSHTTITGGPHDVRDHIESRTEWWGKPKELEVTDVHMVYLGECPANVKPGQYLSPQGEIYDPAALDAPPAR